MSEQKGWRLAGMGSRDKGKPDRKSAWSCKHLRSQASYTSHRAQQLYTVRPDLLHATSNPLLAAFVLQAV